MSTKPKAKKRSKKVPGWEVTFEELWKPNDEEAEHLAKNIDWRKVKEVLMKPDFPGDKALKILDHFKDLIGADRYVDVMLEIDTDCTLFNKVSKYGVHKTYY